jgi:hypothetical protein
MIPLERLTQLFSDSPQLPHGTACSLVSLKQTVVATVESFEDRAVRGPKCHEMAFDIANAVLEILKIYLTFDV